MTKTPVKKTSNAAPLKSAKQLKKIAPLVNLGGGLHPKG
jgi:hypothetical protein